MLRKSILVLAALLASAPAAFGLTVTGKAEVIDSDVLMLNEYQIYLLGVESVESDQVCAIGDEIWECYPPAVRALQTIAEEGELSCDIISGPNFLQQAIARCTSNGTDIGERYVRAGWGLTVPAETDAYEDDMKAAQDEKIGLWQGVFYAPADWRRAQGIFTERPTFRPPTPVN